jgi:hypothetical protein
MLSNITIAHVPNDANKIALIFENLGLFKTKKICVFPEFSGKSRFYRAYVEVEEWCDREMAYNLIKRIKNPRQEARVVYDDDDWWAVEETETEDLKYTQSQAFEQWTTNYYEEVVRQAQSQEEFHSDEFEGKVQVEADMAFQQMAMMV